MKPKRKRRRSFEDYKPVQEHGGKHHLSGNELLETFGEEYAIVMDQHRKDPTKVWTIVECDGKGYVTAGWHFVNRLGYAITEHSWESDDINYRW